MTDRAANELSPEDLAVNMPVGAVDASGEPIDPAAIVQPAQAPMDDAASGQDGGDKGGDGSGDVDDVSTDDLGVQGGA